MKKLTAVQELITYFEQQKKQGCKNWCIEDLLAQLHQAKEIEKNQIGKAFLNGRFKEIGQGVLFDAQPLIETFDNYYNEIFKPE